MNVSDSQITAAGCLLISKDKKIAAFARRGNTSKLGLPCGKREEESVALCAVRETEEEIGFKVNLKGDELIFIYKPDDKQEQNLDEYCATYIIYLEQGSEEITFGKANIGDDGEVEGFGVWVTPEEFIHSSNSAFLDYNTNLLKFADLI